MEKYKITKLGNVDNPKHKNSNFGESKEFHVGYFVENPVIGQSFILIGFNYANQGIITSKVTKIIDENTFETLNSVYKFEKLVY